MKYIVKALKTYLKSPLTSSATSVILKKFVDSKNNALTLADFGDWGVIVIKQGEQIEMIKFDGISTDVNGVATLDVATNGRNIDPTTPYAGSSTGLSFQSGAEVIVTNDPLSVMQFANVNVENTFAVPQKQASDPIDDEDLVTKSWVLENLPAGAVSRTKTIINGVCGENVSAGNLVYEKSSDGKWWKANATLVATIHNVKLGIAQGSGVTNGAITNGVLISGLDQTQTGASIGLAYASDTAGAISGTTGTNERVIGVFTDTDELIFDQNFYYNLTKAQKDVLNTLDPDATLLDTEDVTQGSVAIDTQTTSTDTFNVGEANTTTNQNKLAQKFTATRDSYKGITLNKKADTGTFTGTVTVSLQADTAGSPSGTALATVTISNDIWLLLSAGDINLTFASEYSSAVRGTSYWIVIQTSTSDTTNHPNFGGRSSGGTGNVKYNNTTDGWVSFANSDLFYKTWEGNLNKIVETNQYGEIERDITRINSIVNISTTTVSVSATSPSYTNFLTKYIQKDYFSRKSVIHIKMWYTNDGNGSEDTYIRLTLNGSSVFSFTYRPATSVVQEGFVDIYVVNNESLSSQNWYAFFTEFATSGATIAGKQQISSGTSSVDTSSGAVLKIDGSRDASSVQFSHKASIIEISG